jgi:hypothetical protein
MLFLLILYKWYFSNVFECFHFFCVLIMSIVSVMVPYVCPMFNMWLEYPKLPLLFLTACMCSLYLLWNVLPVCPMYFSGQSRLFIWKMSLLLYLSVCGWCFTMFCIVFCILNDIIIWVFLNSFVISHVSFPLYVKVANFVFHRCESMSVFCFCGARCFMTFYIIVIVMQCAFYNV